MRTGTVVVSVALMILVTAGFAPAAVKDPGEFMGLKWLKSPAECKKLGLCTDEPIDINDKLNNELVLKGAPTEIYGIPVWFTSFSFLDNRHFLGVASFEPGTSSFEKMKEKLVAAYGKPKMESSKMASWTLGNTRIQLTSGGVVFSHIPTLSAVSKAKQYPPVLQPKRK
jgi:hypothetical protein